MRTLLLLWMMMMMVVVLMERCAMVGDVSAPKARFYSDGSALFMNGGPSRETAAAAATSATTSITSSAAAAGSRLIGIGIEELRNDVHDDSEQRKIQSGDSGATFGRRVARIHVVGCQQSAD